MKKQKALKLNMLINSANGLMKIIFPLITFPYASKVLGVNGIGAFSFSASIISYFILLAGLGIETYAIREGAKVKDDKVKFENLANEIFSINLITTLISCIVFFGVLIFSKSLRPYLNILLVLSLQLFFTTIGVEWIYQLNEEFSYIALRAFVFNVLSLILLFLFVRSEKDVVIYTCISVVSSVGSKIVNYIHSRKYCRLRFTRNIRWKTHFKPIILLFAGAVTVTIFVQSDTTILGLIHGEHTVGIYAVSNKLYTIMKSIMSSMIIVSIPRLSYLWGVHEYKLFENTASDVCRTIWTMVLPAATGIVMLRKEIILLISDSSFLTAQPSFAILAITLVFCLPAWFWSQCILVPLGFEKRVFLITLVCALVNIVLNFILIPIYFEVAAAFTTLLAQAIELIWCYIIGKKYVYLEHVSSTIIKSIAGCAVIVATCHILRFISSNVIYVLLCIIVSVCLYFVLEIILKNDAIYILFEKFFSRFRKKLID